MPGRKCRCANCDRLISRHRVERSEGIWQCRGAKGSEQCAAHSAPGYPYAVKIGRYYLAYRADCGRDTHVSLWLARRYRTATAAGVGVRAAQAIAARWHTSEPVVVVAVLEATA